MAKIDYLENHQLTETLPYYWAGFTLTGSNKAVKLSSNKYWQMIVVCAISFILITVIVYFKRRKKSLDI